MKAYNQISQSAVYREDEVSVSLTVCGGSYGGGTETLVVEQFKKNCTVYRKSARAKTADDATTWVGADSANTLNSFDVGEVRCNELVVEETYQTVTGPLMANSHPGSYTGQDAYQHMMPVQRNVVRRLTPLECERLQGFPDGWTDIGEWVDSKGKKHKDADSPRYKALGNSIALPFWCILAKRISAIYDRDITMGSLFDGIGGFPYAFEKCNGKGAARWASEIEEFPMAVTKLRFGED